MANQALTKEEINASIESYLAGESAYLISNRLNVNTAQFLKWVDEHRANRDVQPDSSDLRGFPVMANALAQALTKPALVKKEEPVKEETERKRRKNLSADEKTHIIDCMILGEPRMEVAKRFDVSPNTVTNIMFAYNNQSRKETSVMTIPQGQTPRDGEFLNLEGSNVEKIYGAKDVGVFFEEEFVTIRIPKKTFTKELLRGLV